MLRIGIFTLALLWAMPASAEPITITLFGAAFAATMLGKVVTFAITALISMAISFVANALFKQPQRSSAPAQQQNPTVDNKLTVRQPAASARVLYGKSRASGVYAFLHTVESNNKLLMVIMFAGHPVEAFDEIWMNDEIVTLDVDGNVTSGKFAGKARFIKHLGAYDQEACSVLMGLAPDKWTAEHRLRGIAYLTAILTFDNDAYAGGTPNVTAVIRGKNDIYDPRDDSTGYTANSALIVADYLCDTVYGVPVDYDTGIDEDALIAAANAADEDVALAAGGTEKRYECNGSFSSGEQPDAILGRLVATMHGKALYDGNRWTIHAGVYQSPVLTLTDDDMHGPSTLTTLVSARDRFSAVKGTFVGPANAWQEADFPPVVSSAFDTYDGQRRYKDASMPMTSSASMAQRIAKIDLLKSRQEIVEEFTGKLSCLRVRAGMTIARTSDRYGWTAKPFEVTRRKFRVDQDAAGNPVLVVSLVLKETAAAVYDWSTSEESLVDSAPNTNFPAVFTVLPPSNLTAVESLYSTKDGGGAKAMVTLSFVASPDSFVQSGGHYRGSVRLNGTSVWSPLPAPAPGSLFIEHLDVDPGIYDYRVEAVNWAGVASDPLTVTLAVSGLAAPPAAPQNLTVVAMESFALARCTLAPELDVRQGGFIEFRHSSATTGATWDTSLSLCDPLPAISGAWALPLKAGTYLAKFYDSSGIPSATAASFVQAQSSAHEFTALPDGVSEFAPTFAGTKSGVTVSDDDALTLDGGGLISEVPLMSALPSVAFTGGAEAEGYIDYEEIMDLGAVTRCRLTSTVESEIRAVLDRIRSRTTLVSTWPRVGSGATGDEGDSWLLVSHTQTNPAGSPTWTAWERLDSSTYQARAFRFRRVLKSNDSSFTPAILLDDVIAEGV